MQRMITNLNKSTRTVPKNLGVNRGRKIMEYTQFSLSWKSQPNLITNIFKKYKRQVK